MTWLLYLGSIAASFGLAFLKSFQSKNIIGDQKQLAFMTSIAITTCEVATITFVIKGGWIIIFTSGLGGAVGVVLAMVLHDRIFHRRPVVIHTRR